MTGYSSITASPASCATTSSSPLDTNEVAHYLFRGDIKVKKLITHHFGLEQIREALEVKKRAVDLLKIIVYPHEE